MGELPPLDAWVAEGPVRREPQEDGSVTLSSAVDAAADADEGHWTLWCPVEFPDHVRIQWSFRPISEPGLAMIFFAATGTDGRDLLSDRVARRDGRYPQYHSGDVQALHLSYLRHKWPEERAFRTCNIRKSPGFHLVAQAADPLPPAQDALDDYRMVLIKDGPRVRFLINDLPVLDWTDNGSVGGPPYGGGRIGFRQMAPLVARYRDIGVEPL